MGRRDLDPSVEEERRPAEGARPAPAGQLGNAEWQAASADPAAMLALSWPGAGNAARARALGDRSEHTLQLDPDIVAQLRAIGTIREMLRPEAVAEAFLRTLPPTLPPPLPAQRRSEPGAGPVTPREAGPEIAREAGPADLGKALLAVPEVREAIDALSAQATEQVLRAWETLSTGNQVALVSTVAVVATGTVAGVAQDPALRELALGALGGTVLPVPTVPGLGVQLDLGADRTMVGLHLDVGRLLPAVLGFGPGSPKPL